MADGFRKDMSTQRYAQNLQQSIDGLLTPGLMLVIELRLTGRDAQPVNLGVRSGETAPPVQPR